MSFLFSIWIVSGLTLIGVLFFAQHRAAKNGGTPQVPLVQLGDFVASEITALHRDFYRLLEVLKPHGKRSLSAGLVMVKRGQDVFIHRVYGRIQSERGRASSFFLKQIAENKELNGERENTNRSM